MAKSQAHYVCQSCGASYPKWTGRCDDCGEWNSLQEEARGTTPGGMKVSGNAKSGGREISFVGLEGQANKVERRVTKITEFDRVTGGGLVPGSAVLVGGDPGIGKSTLLLQAVAALGKTGTPCAYVSGEEAVDQVRLRAARLGLASSDVLLASATSVRDLVATLDKVDAPPVVIIDSIQTMYVDSLESAPGTVAQVRASSHELIRVAKQRGFCLILVGHVTKEGSLAGPKVLEHMVDAVLTFEGERGHQFRILRAVKNRYGATDEIGVFEMTDGGLVEVANPSALFLADHNGEVSGASVFAGVEGTRPVLVEIQALVSPSPLGTPRRAVIGWDSGRLAMVLAVLEARCGVSMAGKDVYLNVAGGLRISEPAADLAVAAALISAACDKPVPERSVVFGEIGLSGEIRAVNQGDQRLKEASKLGFKRAFVPVNRSKKSRAGGKLSLKEINHLQDLVAAIAAGASGD
ncbi:DNA repair protein RadA [Rhodovibrionaceae bacterium A322]